MKVAIAGGTGFIGSALTNALLERGDEVWVITRSPRKITGGETREKLHGVTWGECAAQPGKLQGVEAVVNLAGETINQRWTAGAKKRIVDSRLFAAREIARLAERLEPRPHTVINSSGVSIYGTSETETFDEDSPAVESDFLSRVAVRWEEAAGAIPAGRVIRLRTGVVLGRGGAFPLMALPYRLFAGGRIGSGRQWMSWIHIEDMVRLILHCLDTPGIAGPVNATSPEPVTNDRFGRALAKAMGRPHWLPVPAAAMKALLGEMSTLLLDGQRVIPRKALETGFRFRFPDIQSAVHNLVGR